MFDNIKSFFSKSKPKLSDEEIIKRINARRSKTIDAELTADAKSFVSDLMNRNPIPASK